ncbi:hypothetical protein SMG44B_20676 [Stenotrophomonas maltophilia]
MGTQRPMTGPAWGWPSLERLDHWTVDAV